MRAGLIEFTIKVLKADNEEKTFNVYQQDSSDDAARKLVTNLKLESDLVVYFSAYIEELR